MPVALDRSLIHAINAEASTPLGRRYDRWARKTYGISGKLLMARTTAGEGGGRSTRKMRREGIQSSAGARGPAQFISSTRDAFIQQYGVDPWKNDRSAMRGMMLHHLNNGGVAGYNPGMPSYQHYIMSQRIDPDSWHALKTGGGSRSSGPGRRFEPGTPGSLRTTNTVIPGQDLSGERDALRMQTLTTALSQGRMASQSELLGMAAGLRELQDTPAQTEVGLEFVPGKRGRWVGAGRRPPAAGGKIVTATGRSVQRMLRYAEGWDRAKVPYLLGGGHGSIAKPGDRVDCSGGVSAVIGLDTPLVSGDLARWGKPGKGKWVTVYANDGHTFMSIRDPRTKKVRWFGTSKSNPGGGFGEMPKPSASYLSSFAVRHPG